MDNVNHRLLGPATRNALQRLALGSLYLSLLFVLLSVSFITPVVSDTTQSVSETTENPDYSPEAGMTTPALPAESVRSASREG